MIIGAIGPSLMVDKFSIVARDIPEVTIRPLWYETMLEAPRIAAERQAEVDALYFSGTSPYFLAASAVQPLVPWFYLDRPVSGLPFAFLEARRFLAGPVDLSIDTLSELDINDSVLDFDFPIDHLYTYPLRPSVHYDDDLIGFHLSHLRSGRTKLCMTCAYVVYRKLREMGFPVFLISPTIRAIREAMTSSLKVLESSDEDHLKLVVGLFVPELSFVPDDQREETEHAFRRAVFAYAKQRDLFVFQRNPSTLQSVQTYSRFLGETDNFRKTPIANAGAGMTPGLRLRIGYGVASNVKIAEMYAEKALDMGLRKESTACYLFDGENGWAVGELKPSFVLAQPDPGFRELSQRINATPSTLSRYLKAFRLLDAPFSAAEFSSVLDIHPKSARKILARCLNAGFIRIESTRAPLRKGRPENLYACDPNVGKRLNC